MRTRISSSRGGQGGFRCSVAAVCVLAAIDVAMAQEEAPKREARLETVVVTATRTGLAPEQPPASVTVLDRQDIADSADVTVDDILRTIPGFSLYRRSSSMVISPDLDPEAQGVTLRGIGPSGASRALVLVDGIPLIDPFDGQVFWGKISKEQIERIDVVRGASASLWGNYAMAGVINIITRKPIDTGAAVEASYGTDNLTDDNLFVSGRSGKFVVGFEGDFFNTDGFPIIAKSQRGPIDGDASSRHEVFNGRVGYRLNDTDTVFLHGQFFDEDHNDGTPLRTSGTNAGLIDLSTVLHTDDGSEWQVQVFSNMQSFHTQFTETSKACSDCHSSLSQPDLRTIKPLRAHYAAEADPHAGIVDDRTGEHRTLYQVIPFTDVGGSLVWSRRVLDRLVTTAGVDLHWIDGQSRDSFFDDEGIDVQLRRRTDGKQFFAGVFLQGIYTPAERWEIALGGRVDVWDNYDGTMSDTPDVGAASSTIFPNRTDAAFNPKLSVLYHATDWFNLRGAAYRAFRAPNLAELYRQSSVEGLQMLPDPGLTAEHLTGAEFGVDLFPLANLDLRATGFWDEIEDPVTNIDVDPSLCQSPGGEVAGGAAQDEEGTATCRKRTNLGLARTIGAEFEALYEVLPGAQIYGSYLFADATLVSAPPQDKDLEGNRLAQIPPHTVTLGTRYSNPKLFTLALEGRFVDEQFEDADNQDKFGSFFVLNGSLSRRLPFWNGEVFIAAENMLNREYTVDLGGGVRKTGSPLLVHGGLRFKL